MQQPLISSISHPGYNKNPNINGVFSLAPGTGEG